MKKYLSFFRIRFSAGLQYRAAAAAGVATQFAWGAMEILLFRAFYQASPADFPMGLSQLSAYIWLQQAFLALFASWVYDNEIFEIITRGNIAYELARPLDLYGMWFTKNLALRLSRAVLRCAPILVVAAFLPAPYGMSLPSGAAAFSMFLLTMGLAALLVNAFCMLVYIATFYTLNPLGIRIVALSLTEFLTGAIIPLPFLPDRVRRAVELTPFAGMQNLPFRIYSGNVAGAEMARAVFLQVFWLAALLGLGVYLMRISLRRVVVQGG